MIFRFVDKKQKLMTEILAIFLLPVLLIQSGIIPVQFRFFVLFFAVVFIILISIRERYTNKDLGIRTDNIKSSLNIYLLFILVSTIALVYYAKTLGLNIKYELISEPWFLMTFIPVSVFQEVAFRGFLIKILGDVYTDKVTIVIINSLLFMALHAFYPYPLIMLPLALISGIAFSAIYIYRPNLILVSIAHVILNFVAVVLGFFNI